MPGGTDVNVKISCSGVMQVIIVSSAWQHAIFLYSYSGFERNVVRLCIYPISNQNNHNCMAMDIIGFFLFYFLEKIILYVAKRQKKSHKSVLQTKMN